MTLLLPAVGLRIFDTGMAKRHFAANRHVRNEEELLAALFDIGRTKFRIAVNLSFPGLYWNMDEQDRLSLEECTELFAAMFAEGPAGDDVLSELTPDGWEKSDLLAVAHPSPQTLFAEALRMHNNLLSLTRNRASTPEPPAPTLEEITASNKPSAVDTKTECAEIVGWCLWDIFSDNHEVVAADSRIADIGSFRGAAGFIADWMNQAMEREGYDYMDFYMGTIWIAQRADMSPVYRMIFHRLKRLRCDWTYSFPRLGAVQFRNEAAEDNIAYDPSAGFAKEQENAKRQKEFDELQQTLTDAYNESVCDSRTLPPPPVVQAYLSVYGRFPKGWPPTEDSDDFGGL